MKKLRVTLKCTGNPKVTYGARLPVEHAPKAMPTAPRGLEALVRAQSDLPRTGAARQNRLGKGCGGRKE
jgi:hypothetical protein